MGFYRFLSGLYYAGMTLIFAGIIMHISHISGAPWVLITGIIPVLGIRIFNYIIAPADRKRINGVLMVSAVFLTIAIISIYLNRSYWVIFIAISAVLDGYVSFRKFT